MHFFYIPYLKLLENNHEVLVTSRDKDVATQLLDSKKIDHICLSTAPDKPSLINFAKELIERDLKLRKIVNSFQPDVVTAIGGTFAAHASIFTNARSVIFYDTENATLQNFITYPFVSKLLVPTCYNGWTPKSKTKRYDGFHELSYLHPNHFTPDRELALRNGVNPSTKNFFLRIVSWCANHDLSESGWSNEFLGKIIDNLSKQGNVIISSERTLPEAYQKYLFKGDANALHHVLAQCDLFIGESATIASESVILGVPAIYIANTSRGYVEEQQNRYKLLLAINSFDLKQTQSAINYFLSQAEEKLRTLHQELLESTVDVAELVYQELTNR